MQLHVLDKIFICAPFLIKTSVANANHISVVRHFIIEFAVAFSYHDNIIKQMRNTRVPQRFSKSFPDTELSVYDWLFSH